MIDECWPDFLDRVREYEVQIYSCVQGDALWYYINEPAGQVDAKVVT